MFPGYKSYYFGTSRIFFGTSRIFFGTSRIFLVQVAIIVGVRVFLALTRIKNPLGISRDVDMQLT